MSRPFPNRPGLFWDLVFSYRRDLGWDNKGRRVDRGDVLRFYSYFVAALSVSLLAYIDLEQRCFLAIAAHAFLKPSKRADFSSARAERVRSPIGRPLFSCAEGKQQRSYRARLCG